jgi:hypothetical protein
MNFCQNLEFFSFFDKISVSVILKQSINKLGSKKKKEKLIFSAH